VSLNPGDLIQDKYRITRLIGQGGMGAVYEGENVVIARRVAIKVLHGMLAGDSSVIERFEREAQAAGRIGNDHILEVLDMGRLNNNDRFMVMEYLDGETLDQRCERVGRLTEAELYPILRQLLTGLAAAHAAGIVHRDLKPDNIFVLQQKAGHRDFVKIIDFGISKFTAGGANFKMTMTGAIMGTPYYMAPEQAKGGKNVDMRSDVYAVGVVMFKALAGQVPFQADSFNELIFKIALSETPRLGAVVPDIDPELDAIVAKAMARNLEDRYQSALQLRDALDVWADGRGFASGGAGGGRGSQVGLERDIGMRVTGPGRNTTSDAHGETVTAMQEATHAPWSNSGVTNPSKGRTLWIGLAAFLAVAGIVTWVLLPSDGDEPTAEGPTEPSSLAAEPVPLPPAAEVKPAPPKVEPAPVSAPPPATTTQEEVQTKAASSAPLEVAAPQPKPAPAPSPVVRPAPAPRPVVRPAPVARPTPAPAPAPKPVVKPSPRPRPADLLGY
jgi:eukaryotic-like serine/threonine-protein kinase